MTPGNHILDEEFSFFDLSANTQSFEEISGGFFSRHPFSGSSNVPASEIADPGASCTAAAADSGTATDSGVAAAADSGTAIQTMAKWIVFRFCSQEPQSLYVSTVLSAIMALTMMLTLLLDLSGWV